MVHLRFVRPEWDPAAKHMEYRPVAEVWVTDDHVHIEGDAAVFSTEIPVIEPDTGERLTFDKHGERWARALPTAYRSGDLVVSMVPLEMAAPVGVMHA